MRKAKLILSLALLFGVGCAWAGNSLSVRDVTVAKEGTAVLAIETAFDKDDFIGYQFDVTLPQGLSLALNESSKVVSTSYTDLDIDGKVYGTTETGTTYRLIASKMGNPRIPSGSYVLLSVTVESDGTLNVGEVCACSITDVKFSDSNQQKTEMEDVNFSVTISDKVVLDENSPAVPNATDEEVDILVKRTIKANQWSTICLPFDMTEEQVYSAFGDDVQLAEFDMETGYTVNDDGTIVVNFVDTDLSEGLYGNWPYIIKTSASVSEFEVNAQINPLEDDAVAEYTTGKGKNKRTVGTFTGTLHAGTVIPEENLFLNNNKFYYSVGKTKSKAFRAYFWFENVLEDLSSASSRITLHFLDGSESTGVECVATKSQQTGTTYDLQGRIVNGQSSMVNGQSSMVNGQLKRGLYVRNGKKVIIK